MPRYNKIYAGPVTETLPQVRELPAAVAILPGCIVVASAGTFALATAATAGKVYIAQDNYLAMQGVDTAYAAGDTCIGMEMLDEQFFNARVATGVNVTLDMPLAPGASGFLVAATAADRVVAFADEAYNNTSGASQLVRVRPANGYVTAA